jgi:hypothetical protein
MKNTGADDLTILRPNFFETIPYIEFRIISASQSLFRFMNDTVIHSLMEVQLSEILV